jgi:hypothetical protein
MRTVTFQARPKQVVQTPAEKQPQSQALNLPPVQKQEPKKATEQQGDSFVRFGCSSC